MLRLILDFRITNTDQVNILIFYKHYCACFDSDVFFMAGLPLTEVTGNLYVICRYNEGLWYIGLRRSR